jgi:hypothetical protein
MSSEQLDASNTLMKVLAAGAVAALRPNRMYVPDFQKEIMPVYLQLKAMIEERYGQSVDVDLLDSGPGSPERQQAMVQQLQASGAAGDEAVMHQARKLAAIIAEENPQSFWAANVAETPDDFS